MHPNPLVLVFGESDVPTWEPYFGMPLAVGMVTWTPQLRPDEWTRSEPEFRIMTWREERPDITTFYVSVLHWAGRREMGLGEVSRQIRMEVPRFGFSWLAGYVAPGRSIFSVCPWRHDESICRVAALRGARAVTPIKAGGDFGSHRFKVRSKSTSDPVERSPGRTRSAGSRHSPSSMVWS